MRDDRPIRASGAGALVLLVLLLGCDCAERAQFQLRPSDDVLADTSDRRRVAEVVATAATKVGMADYTADSVEPGTIAFFREPLPRENPRTLHVGARSAGGLVVVDAGLWNPSCERARKAKFSRLLKSLSAGLTQAFGDRVTLTQDPSEMVELRQPDATPKGSS